MTWLTAASAAVSLGCMLSSTRRFVWALCPTRFDARLLAKGLGSNAVGNAPKLRDAIAEGGRSDWEVGVLGALNEASRAARDARLSEELTEFDQLAERWSRVPRVCASVATSAGFLFASIALIQDLATLDSGSASGVGMQAGLFSALDSLAVGVAGTSFCAAVHVRARRAARDRLEAAARLVETLEACCGADEPSADSGAAGRAPAL